MIGVAEVAAAAARLEAAFDRPWLRLYSLKANDLPAITSLLHDRGWGASVVSAGEWRHALPAKPPAGQAGRGHWTATGLLDTDLEGPVCESTDSFGRHVLPPLDRGDLVAIEQAGAYGASFTSRYNGRPAPAEILLWLDGSLQPCERPLITPVAVTPARAPGGPARSGR